MCNRFGLTPEVEELVQCLGLDGPPPGYAPREDIRPTESVGVVVQEGGKRSWRWMRWGLIPAWTLNPKDGALLTSARAETAAQKPAFRSAMRMRRCLIPASCFYEWKKDEHRRVPHRFCLADGGLMAFAGIWEHWDGPGGPIDSVAILTVPPDEVVAPIHDRMPAIVQAGDMARWLRFGQAEALLAAWGSARLRAEPCELAEALQ